MSKYLISITEVSRLNAISSNRNEIVAKEKEASQAIQQLNGEYNSLSREYENRNKLVKKDDKVKDKQ
jgi:hypothetical protein